VRINGRISPGGQMTQLDIADADQLLDKGMLNRRRARLELSVRPLSRFHQQRPN
jgi:hypothetical protein